MASRTGDQTVFASKVFKGLFTNALTGNVWAVGFCVGTHSPGWGWWGGGGWGWGGGGGDGVVIKTDQNWQNN